MFDKDVYSSIRSKIRPFPCVATYPTGWGGKLTFEQIAAQVSPRAAWKFKHFGVYGQDIPDSLQTGLMKLWETLSETPDMLADKGLGDAMWIVIGASNSNWHVRYHRRYMTFTDVVDDNDYDDADEYGISGLTNPSEWWCSNERWAAWASKVDFRLDITEAIHAIAEEYADDIKGLVALYILTTSADSQATLDAHNLAHSMVYERMTAIKHRLQRILKEYEPIQPRTWQERLQSGEVEPYLTVVEHYQDKPLALFALYTLTTEAQVRKFARDEKERKMITYYRKKCLKRIEAAYGRAASF
jgi:hypothetical protein